MGKHSRDKGKRGEREVCGLVRPLWPQAKRATQSRSGEDYPDVDGTPFWIECKIGKRPNIRAAMAQALEAKDSRQAVIFNRRDREEWLVTMRAEDWIELVGNT